MAKSDPFDSGGMEARAVLGEEFAEGLGVLLGAIRVPVPREWASLGEGSFVGALVALLLAVELLCLLHAYQRHQLALGAAILALMAAELLAVARLARAEADVVFVSEVVTRKVPCKSCGEPFLVEPGYRPGEPSPRGMPRDLRAELQVCSSRCALGARLRG